MAQGFKDRYMRFKVVESCIRRTQVDIGLADYIVKPHTAVFIHDLYVEMAAIWFDVSLTPLLLSKRWVNALCEKPLFHVTKLFKDVDFQLIAERHQSYASFKHWLASEYGWCGQLLAPLKSNILQFYSEGTGLKELRTALRFITRANLPEHIKVLEEEAFASWLERCLSLKNPVDTSPEREVLKGIFPPHKGVVWLDGFVGRFGPGQSAFLDGDKTLAAKYKNFCCDAMLKYCATHLGFEPEVMPYYRRVDSVRCGEMHFVPKALDTYRVVTSEPSQLMFFQLGIAKIMTAIMEKSWWQAHIKLRDANFNQMLARDGSVSGYYATIDLSNASDTVSFALVKDLFRGTSVEKALICSRSRAVEYAGQIFKPTYFAPMGSGLCFPVETAVFAAVVSGQMGYAARALPWGVYGDDIVVPVEFYDRIVERLTQLGFQVNSDKSFGIQNTGFRESCGGDFFYGEDVRPVLCSRRWKGFLSHEGKPQSTGVAAYEGQIDLANRLKCFPIARSRVIEDLRSLKQGQPLFDFDGRRGIASAEPTNWQNTHYRYNQSLQSGQVKHLLVRAEPLPSQPDDEGIRYFECLRSMADSPMCIEREAAHIGGMAKPRFAVAWGSPCPGWPARSR